MATPNSEAKPRAEKADTLGRVLAFAATAAGLVAYLYMLGGIVVWLKLQTARLSPDGAIVAINDRRLLAVGSRVVAFEIFLLLAASASITALVAIVLLQRRELPRQPIRQFDDLVTAWSDKGTLSGFIGSEASLLLIAVGLSVNNPSSLRTSLWIVGAVFGFFVALAVIFHEPPKHKAGEKSLSGWRSAIDRLGDRLGLGVLRFLATLLLAAALIAAIILVPLLQGTILLAATALIYAGPFMRWPRATDSHIFRRELARSSGLWMAVAVSTAVALAWVATPPVSFPSASLEMPKGEETRSGAYIDRNGEGTYLGVCTVSRDDPSSPPISSDAKIEFLSSENVERLQLDSYTYDFDPGGRPSLGQVIVAIFGDGDAGDPCRGNETLARAARPPGPLTAEVGD
jgi:hypothetical protein